MSTSLRSRTLYYKNASITDVTTSIADLLRAALTALPKVGDRMQPAPHDPGSVRLINETLLDKNYVFGSIVEWTHGRFQHAITLDPEKPSLEVNLMPPEEKQEWLEGMGYFLAFKNHVILSKGRGIGSGAFEHHFNWLLRDKAQLVPRDSDVFLFEAPQTDSRLSAPVRSIALAPGPIYDAKGKSGLAVESVTARRELAQVLIDALRSMNLLKLGEEKLEKLLAARNVKASIRLSYAKSKEDDGDQILDVLANALRNADDEWGYTLDVPGVGLVRGDKLTLKTSVQVPHTIGLDPDPTGLAGAMWTWLQQLIQRQEVPT